MSKKVKAAPVAVSKKPTAPVVEFFEEVEQGSDEWFALRLGIPTASLFSVLLAEGRDGEASISREDLLDRYAGELLSGRPAEFTAKKIKTAAMERGTEMEPRARAYYQQTHLGVKLEQIGFVRRRLPSGRFVGASPDAKVAGQKKGLEIKTVAPHLLVKMQRKGLAAMPPAFRAQVHGTMYVTDWEEMDLQLYYDGMPHQPVFTVLRNEELCREIDAAVQTFDHELHKIVAAYRSTVRR